MNTRIALMAVLLSTAPISPASSDTAADILKRCEGSPGDAAGMLADAEWCNGFLEALTGTHSTFVVNKKVQPYFCLPENVRMLDVKVAIVSWLKNHPELLHEEGGASFFAIAALAQTFPCKSHSP